MNHHHDPFADQFEDDVCARCGAVYRPDELNAFYRIWLCGVCWVQCEDNFPWGCDYADGPKCPVCRGPSPHPGIVCKGCRELQSIPRGPAGDAQRDRRLIALGYPKLTRAGLAHEKAVMDALDASLKRDRPEPKPWPEQEGGWSMT